MSEVEIGYNEEVETMGKGSENDQPLSPVELESSLKELEANE